MKRLFWCAALAFGCSTACGDPLELPASSSDVTSTPSAEEAFGQLSLALQTGASGAQYELLDARFEVVGPESTTLQSIPGDTSTELKVALAVGSYEVTLLDGWSLQDAGGNILRAQVKNPTLAFDIKAGATTALQFAFEVTAPMAPAAGSLAVSIAVTTAPDRLLLISELMINPAQVSDTGGEWIELWNAGSTAVDLTGCSLQRDAQSYGFSAPTTLPAGAFATFATSTSPGFTPTWASGALSLPNSSTFTLSVVCTSETLDSITVDPSSWNVQSGVSLALDPNVMDTAANDLADTWCPGTASYDGDLGSPGAANSACP